VFEIISYLIKEIGNNYVNPEYLEAPNLEESSRHVPEVNSHKTRFFLAAWPKNLRGSDFPCLGRMADKTQNQFPNTESLTETIHETEAHKQFRRAEPKQSSWGSSRGGEETHQQIHGERKRVSPGQARKGTGTG
jgi:hypothetical protein